MVKLLACLLGMFVSLRAGQAPSAADKPKDEKCSIEGRVVNSATGDEGWARIGQLKYPQSTGREALA
jgi:hypothetical protein